MVINTIFNGITVNVELNNGVNLLSGNSGTGKTLLMQAIELYCLNEGISYTFGKSEFANYAPEQIVSICSNSDVVLLDNADLYITEDLLKEIKCGDKLIVISLKISNKISMKNVREYLVNYEKMYLSLEEI